MRRDTSSVNATAATSGPRRDALIGRRRAKDAVGLQAESW